jgi:hypothetical protein
MFIYTWWGCVDADLYMIYCCCTYMLDLLMYLCALFWLLADCNRLLCNMFCIQRLWPCLDVLERDNKKKKSVFVFPPPPLMTYQLTDFSILLWNVDIWSIQPMVCILTPTKQEHAADPAVIAEIGQRELFRFPGLLCFWHLTARPSNYLNHIYETTNSNYSQKISHFRLSEPATQHLPSKPFLVTWSWIW